MNNDYNFLMKITLSECEKLFGNVKYWQFISNYIQKQTTLCDLDLIFKQHVKHFYGNLKQD